MNRHSQSPTRLHHWARCSTIRAGDEDAGGTRHTDGIRRLAVRLFLELERNKSTKNFAARFITRQTARQLNRCGRMFGRRPSDIGSERSKQNFLHVTVDKKSTKVRGRSSYHRPSSQQYVVEVGDKLGFKYISSRHERYKVIPSFGVAVTTATRSCSKGMQHAP